MPGGARPLPWVARGTLYVAQPDRLSRTYPHRRRTDLEAGLRGDVGARGVVRTGTLDDVLRGRHADGYGMVRGASGRRRRGGGWTRRAARRDERRAAGTGDRDEHRARSRTAPGL